MYINNLDNYRNLQHNINRFTNWCKINPTKCKKITFKRKRQYINFSYNVNGTPIMDTRAIKYLGINLNSKLYFKEHIGYIINRAKQICKKTFERINFDGSLFYL